MSQRQWQCQIKSSVCQPISRPVWCHFQKWCGLHSHTATANSPQHNNPKSQTKPQPVFPPYPNPITWNETQARSNTPSTHIWREIATHSLAQAHSDKTHLTRSKPPQNQDQSTAQPTTTQSQRFHAIQHFKTAHETAYAYNQHTPSKTTSTNPKVSRTKGATTPPKCSSKTASAT